MEQTKKQDLNELKESYGVLRGKYKLPDFYFLNENFEIEDLSDIETDLLLRKIRKQIFEKINGVMRTLEAFLNPSNAPIFVLNMIRGFSDEDKKIIDNLYKQLAAYALDSFHLEVKYDEKKEADMINRISKDWPMICETLENVYGSMKSGSGKGANKKEKSYFG